MGSGVGLLAVSVALTNSACAQPAMPSSPIENSATAASPQAGDGALRFAITHFVVHGNTLVSQATADEILAPYLGPGRDFGTVQQALEVLEKAYAAKGFNAVQVILPEQTLESGTVHFLVVESRLKAIRVQGNRNFSTENYERALPSLVVGNTPNFDEMVDNLRLLNENPAKQATVVMRAGENEGEVEAVVRASDQPPVRFAVTLDNTGNTQTGPFRVGMAVQHANLFDRDHVASFQAITSPLRARQVRIYGLGYQAPLYSTNGVFGMFLGYSNVNSGLVSTVGGNFNIAGSGVILGLRYTQLIPKRGDWEHKLALGWDAHPRRTLRAAGGPHVHTRVRCRTECRSRAKAGRSASSSRPAGPTTSLPLPRIARPPCWFRCRLPSWIIENMSPANTPSTTAIGVATIICVTLFICRAQRSPGKRNLPHARVDRADVQGLRLV
ncbi:MAG: POTRA domain-containing protein [Saprospiraceae bacterium]